MVVWFFVSSRRRRCRRRGRSSSGDQMMPKEIPKCYLIIQADGAIVHCLTLPGLRTVGRKGGTCVLVGSDVVADQGHTRGFGRAARRWAAWVEGGRKGGGKAATTGAGGGEEGRRRREGGGKAKEVMLSQDEGGRRVRLGVNRSTRGGGEQQADGFHDDRPPRQAGGQAGRAGQTLHSGLWGLPEAPSPHTYAGGTLCWALLRLGLGAVGRWNPPPVSAMKKANSARPGRYPPWAR